MKPYGVDTVRQRARRMLKDVDKTFRPLVQAVAKTAQNKAKELAPKRTNVIKLRNIKELKKLIK